MGCLFDCCRRRKVDKLEPEVIVTRPDVKHEPISIPEIKHEPEKPKPTPEIKHEPVSIPEIKHEPEKPKLCTICFKKCVGCKLCMWSCMNLLCPTCSERFNNICRSCNKRSSKCYICDKDCISSCDTCHYLYCEVHKNVHEEGLCIRCDNFDPDKY